MVAQGGTVTILFTDLVSSTELLQRAGDEDAQRILQAHQKLLRDAVSSYGGHEVKWLGDGLMVVFPSAANAVRCAVTMQQASGKQYGGERLGVRVGLNAGEPLPDEDDYFGTAVVVARRLCDHAEAGQIICSALVAGLLFGRQAFKFRELGAVDLKGFEQPVVACEVVYRRSEPSSFLVHTPFVGRETESSHLRHSLEQARADRGGLVMLAGEPGIGKTRLAEEFAHYARSQGVNVLWGRCYEGDWTPPYGAFVEALSEYVRDAEPDALHKDLGYGGGPIARLVPSLREKLPGIDEPAPLQPDEERLRILDAFSQFLFAVSARAPLVLVLDDLHWADASTIAMLRHVARFASQRSMLIVGTYRNVEVDNAHPLAKALGALRVEGNTKSLVLSGLTEEQIAGLVSQIVEQSLPGAFAHAVTVETSGNPFFVREVLLHLVQRGALHKEGGVWKGNTPLIAEIGLPASLREAIERRLSGLSSRARTLLSAASAFEGGFPFEIVAATAALNEHAALDALDEALDAQIVRPGVTVAKLEFSHALFRHALYAELSPPRQARLHRKTAEALARAPDAADRAAEIAYHYHKSSTLPGAERGVEFAIVAADEAQASYAYADAATYLRVARDLLSGHDPRRPRLLARLGLALVWALEFEEAATVIAEAGGLIAGAEGHEAAAQYFLETARALRGAGSEQGAWRAASQGLRYAGERRDQTWAMLMQHDIVRREAEDPDHPGLPLDSPDRRMVYEVLKASWPADMAPWYVTSREEALRRADAEPIFLLTLLADLRRALLGLQEAAGEVERRGQIADAILIHADIARCHNALGNLAAAQAAYERGGEFAARHSAPTYQLLNLITARYEMALALNEGWDAFPPLAGSLLGGAAEHQWAFAPIRAGAAVVYAQVGQHDGALRWLRTLEVALEQAPGWAANYTLMACSAALALWLLGATDMIDVIERNLREKVVSPDFRYPMHDGRLSLARLCALQGRHREAVEWFQNARGVLDEQGARPLRAIVDYDEALMYVRRGRRGDRTRALPLVEAALTQFRSLSMTGWIRRAEALRGDIEERADGVAVHPDGLTSREVDVLRRLAAGRTNTEIGSDLTLSVRTVARHITNIYTKIGARNRAEATDYAHRHGLK